MLYSRCLSQNLSHKLLLQRMDSLIFNSLGFVSNECYTVVVCHRISATNYCVNKWILEFLISWVLSLMNVIQSSSVTESQPQTLLRQRMDSRIFNSLGFVSDECYTVVVFHRISAALTLLIQCMDSYIFDFL